MDGLPWKHCFTFQNNSLSPPPNQLSLLHCLVQIWYHSHSTIQARNCVIFYFFLSLSTHTRSHWDLLPRAIVQIYHHFHSYYPYFHLALINSHKNEHNSTIIIMCGRHCVNIYIYIVRRVCTLLSSVLMQQRFEMADQCYNSVTAQSFTWQTKDSTLWAVRADGPQRRCLNPSRLPVFICFVSSPFTCPM